MLERGRLLEDRRRRGEHSFGLGREPHRRFAILIGQELTHAARPVFVEMREEHRLVERRGGAGGVRRAPVHLGVEALDVLGRQLHVARADLARAQRVEILLIDHQRVEVAQLRRVGELRDLLDELTGLEAFERLELVDEARHRAALDAHAARRVHLAAHGAGSVLTIGRPRVSDVSSESDSCSCFRSVERRASCPTVRSSRHASRRHGRHGRQQSERQRHQRPDRSPRRVLHHNLYEP